jgi:hypothetical protein
VIFSGNSGEYGGGMLNRAGSNVHLSNAVFSGNTAIQHGGGMYNHRTAPIVSHVSFNGNIAQTGGGMYNRASSARVVNSIVSGNTKGQVENVADRDEVIRAHGLEKGGGDHSDTSSPPRHDPATTIPLPSPNPFTPYSSFSPSYSLMEEGCGATLAHGVGRVSNAFGKQSTVAPPGGVSEVSARALPVAASKRTFGQ